MAKSDNGELNNSNLASSNNSDPNNSLLQKVTKRVSGLFPSSITKWFGPSDGSTTSVIRRRETEDDEEEQLQIQQPPKKRAKPTTTTTNSTEMEFTNHFQMTSTPLMNTRIHHAAVAGPSNYTRHTITSVLYDADADGPSTSTSSAVIGARGEPNICINGGGGGGSSGAATDDKSSDDSGGESTSGYSSVLVQQNKETSFVSDLLQPITAKITTMKETNSPSPNKSLNTSRSLFSDQSLHPQRQCLNNRRPSFNSSTFGSPTFVDRTLSTKRAVNSPFYGGRTVYGGASAYKRNRIIFPRNESQQIQVKNSVTMKPVVAANEHQCNENVSLSKTARRILDTLEHFSTPIVDAKKIPNINKRLQTPYARDQQTTAKPVTRELIVPSVPDLLKMKQKERLQNSTEQVRKLATTSKSVLNEYSIRTLVDDTTKPQKHTTKIKAKITAVREKKNNDLNDTIDAVKLPEIQLPITSLPKFDFILPPPPTSSAIVAKLPTPEKTHNQQYKFAKPTIVVDKSDSPLTTITAINHFKFSEPIDAKTPPPSSSSTIMMTFKGESYSTAPRKKDTKNNGQNTAPEVGFNLKPSEKLSQGSVMDILGGGGGKTINTKTDSIMDKFKPSIGTWECQACMVRNIPSAMRCVACETLKEPIKKKQPETPLKTNLINNTTSFGNQSNNTTSFGNQSNNTTSFGTQSNNTASFGTQFKMSAEKWECTVCMVRNNMSDTKCVACTTPNTTSSSAKTPTKSPVNTISSNFGDKFKPASNTWECDACMIRNKSQDDKCVACETPKPGTGKSDTNKPTLIMNIAPATTPSSGGFGDFIKKQQTTWECPSCMVRNPPEKKACVCCEAPKPGEKQEFTFGNSTGTQFKFGIMGNDTSSSTKSNFTFGANTTSNCNPVTSGFTFGVKPSESQPSTTAATFSFGNPTTTTTQSNVVLNGDPKKLFSFGTQNTTSTIGTQSTTITSTSSTTKSTNIFNPIVPQQSSESSNNSTVSSTVAVTTMSTVSPTTTFSFGVTPKLDDKKTPTTVAAAVAAAVATPQFNFGGSSGSLPFNAMFGNITKTNTSFETTTTTANAALTTTTTNTANFSFKPTTTVTPILSSSSSSATTNNNNNKTTEVKPFSFTTTTTNNKTNETSKSKFAEFTFNPLTTNTTTAAPLSKAPVINFGGDGSEKTTTPTNSMFSFGGAKTPDNKAPSFGGGSMFGHSSIQTTAATQQQQGTAAPPPQNNGGFNFGATAVTPNFNFGGGTPSSGGTAGATANSNSTHTSTTSTLFGFGSSQAGSGSTTGAPAPGVFTFGGGGGGGAQQPATGFTPDIKPNFNFSGGTPVASFTAQQPGPTMPQRKIRKAVRRTQPR